jgi:hypothetical protein
VIKAAEGESQPVTTNSALEMLRRAGLGFVGLTSTVVLAVGCSSSSNGTPPAGLGGGNQSSQGGGQVNGSSSTPGGKAVAGDFCKDFHSMGNLNASDFTSASRAQKVIAVWDRLADEAPGPIKTDVQTIDNFLKTVESGHPDMSKIQKLTQMDVRIARYIEAHC